MTCKTTCWQSIQNTYSRFIGFASENVSEIRIDKSRMGLIAKVATTAIETFATLFLYAIYPLKALKDYIWGTTPPLITHTHPNTKRTCPDGVTETVTDKFVVRPGQPSCPPVTRTDEPSIVTEKVIEKTIIKPEKPQK